MEERNLPQCEASSKKTVHHSCCGEHVLPKKALPQSSPHRRPEAKLGRRPNPPVELAMGECARLFLFMVLIRLKNVLLLANSACA